MVRLLVGLIYRDTKIACNAFKNFAEIAAGIQAVYFGVEMKYVARFPATVAVIFSSLIIEIERGICVIVERTGSFKLMAADLFGTR